jgi:hypothetical protein
MLLDEKFLDNGTVDGRKRLREGSDKTLLGISNSRGRPVGHGHREDRGTAGSGTAECGATQLVDPVK